MGNLQVLNQKDLMIIFSYAPAGLGHLRVIDALDHGLPQNITPILLGAQDESIGNIHRLTSVSTLGKLLMESIQEGIAEDIFTRIYRSWLRSHTEVLYEQITTLLNQRIDLAKTILVVATHFALAHQIAAIKDKLCKDKQIKIYLIVQVTDDSPQHMWYVPHADLTFVPSHETRQQLLRYGNQEKLSPIEIKVIPYPISPVLSQELSTERQNVRDLQSQSHQNHQVNIIVPVSGAAVQLAFIEKLTTQLDQNSSRFKYHIICRITPYTEKFIARMLTKTHVQLSSAAHRREIVKEYNEIYQKETILLELTKPSEQAFKALLNPKQVGGSILLFSDPVGRQEYDNLNFLIKHKLIPNKSEQRKLWNHAKKNKSFEGNEIHLWRGLILPKHADEAANFIYWCLQKGIFNKMLEFKKSAQENFQEIGDDGVARFWGETAEFLNSQLNK